MSNKDKVRELSKLQEELGIVLSALDEKKKSSQSQLKI